MKRSNQYKVYEYLEKSGVLDNGTSEEIQKVRQEYWKIYKRNWRKNKRNNETEITSSFTESEFELIENYAKSHNLSKPQFVKQAALSYINKKYLVPNEIEVRKITQLLSQYLDVIIDQIEEENFSQKTGDEILFNINKLEKQITDCLRQPILKE